VLYRQNRRRFVVGLLSCGSMSITSKLTAAADAPAIRRDCLDHAINPNSKDIKSAISIDQFSTSELIGYFQQLADHIRREDILLRQFFQNDSAILLAPEGMDAHADSPERLTLGLKFIRLFAPSLAFEDKLKVSGILAHEKSHTFQYKWNVDLALRKAAGQPVKYVELHADYLAGAYMAWREKYQQGAPVELSKLFFNLGDRLNGEDHHGTEQERLNAFTYGYMEFQNNLGPGKPADVISAATLGIQYIKRSLPIRTY
jgi:hypothetical protein